MLNTKKNFKLLIFFILILFNCIINSNNFLDKVLGTTGLVVAGYLGYRICSGCKFIKKENSYRLLRLISAQNRADIIKKCEHSDLIVSDKYLTLQIIKREIVLEAICLCLVSLLSYRILKK